MGLGTTPRTWVAGETVTAALMNTEVRDNMNSLGAGTVMGTPTSTASNGTSTSGGTETRDTVLGNFTFTAVAGRRYAVIVNGLKVVTTVANDLVICRLRNGGASTPTTSSTWVGEGSQLLSVSTSVGATTMALSGSFVPGAGVQTLSVFTVRGWGTGVETPLGTREMYVVDLGPS